MQKNGLATDKKAGGWLIQSINYLKHHVDWDVIYEHVVAEFSWYFLEGREEGDKKCNEINWVNS